MRSAICGLRATRSICLLTPRGRFSQVEPYARRKGPAMRALVTDGPRMLHVGRSGPIRPGPGQARVQVEAVGICGSDLHGLLGETGRRCRGPSWATRSPASSSARARAVRTWEVGSPFCLSFRVAVAHRAFEVGRAKSPCPCDRRRRDLVGGYANLLCVPVENLRGDAGAGFRPRPLPSLNHLQWACTWYGQRAYNQVSRCSLPVPG